MPREQITVEEMVELHNAEADRIIAAGLSGWQDWDQKGLPEKEDLVQFITASPVIMEAATKGDPMFVFMAGIKMGYDIRSKQLEQEQEAQRDAN